MQEPAAREGSTGALKDLTGPDLNAQRPSVPPESADVLAGKATAADAAAARDPNRRSGRTRTVRVRDGFFDSSLLHYVSLDQLTAVEDAGAARRSPKPSRPRASPAADYDDYDDDVPLGQQYQATCIPACRPRPAQPTAAEEKFLHPQPLYVPGEPEDAVTDKHLPTRTRAGRAGVTVPMPPIGVAASSSDFRYKWRWAKDSVGRRSLLSAAVNALDKQLGPEKVQVLGLEGLGFKCRQTWQLHEELLFAMGMCDKYRFFKYIRQCYLWNRSVHELNGYYHNVWKTRSTDLAEEFLTMRLEGATRQEYAAFVDKIRDQLTSMWDKKKMGDMPKLLKDAAALAAAERALAADPRARALAAAAAPKPQQPSKPRPSSRASPEVTGVASYADGYESDGSLDSADSEKRPAQKRPLQQQQQQQQQQRKRAAGSGGVPGRPPKRPAVPVSSSSGQEGSHRPQEHPRSVKSLHASGVNPGLPTWGYPGSLYQRQRTARGGAPFVRKIGSGNIPPLELPVMPRAPRPNNNDLNSIATWLKTLPTFRTSMKHHLAEVHDLTEAAIKECEDFIAQVKVQREQREEEARVYVSALLDQGRQVLAKIEAGEQAQKQAQHLADLRLRQEQRAQQQQPASADAPAQPPAAAGAVLGAAPTAAAAARSASPAPAAAGAPAAGAPAAAAVGPEVQPIKQEQQDTEMADAPLPAPSGPQLQQQQSLPMDAAPAGDQLQQPKDAQYMPAQAPGAGPIAMGPPAGRPARTSWQHQQPGAACKEEGQKQQQPQQQSDTAAGTDVGVAAALPFPGGAAWLSQWTTQPSPAPGPGAVRVQVGNNPDAVVTKHIPRPYVRH